MAKHKDKAVHVSHSGDAMLTPGGYKVLSISWYIRRAKAAMIEKECYDAWLDFGSALARSTDPEEIWDLQQLEREAFKRIRPRKGHKKKDEDKRGKSKEYA
ncbi:MAG: hypothetical protein QQN46_03510 [Nitrosopumilus sp.]